MDNVKVTKASGEGKIKADVTVIEGRLTAHFTLVESGGKHYLNNPHRFVESLKGKKVGGKIHSGFIEDAYITDPAFREEVKNQAMKEMGITET